MSDADLFSRLIYENPDKGYEYRLTLSEFRDVQYLSIRKYFQSYEGEFLPSKEGASIPATIQNMFAILDALIELCSKEEALDSINTHFQERISLLESNKPK